MILPLRWRDLILQLIRFGITGGCAAAVHFSTVVSLVEWELWDPLHANVIGFLVSFVLSFSGHRLWTFAETEGSVRKQLPVFFLTSVSGFGLNQSLFYTFLHHTHMYYIMALILAIGISSAAVFVVSKTLVFRA